MKKYLFTTLLGLSTFTLAKAQEYKVNKSAGKMTLNLKAVSIEGYNGNEIIFKSALKEKPEDDPRAAGLQVISGEGLTDNTGLGVNVTEKGGDINVSQVTTDATVKILVPKGLMISINSHTLDEADTLSFKNMSNEIEVSADYNTVELNNVTGPLSVRSLYGAVDAKFGNNIKGPVSVASAYGAVDITLPTDAKVTVSLSTSYGDILASAALKMDLEKTTVDAKADKMVQYGKNINGKINGGGAEFKLKSEYGKIYLRPRK